MTLSVICAGYARTGTSSLGMALNQLGFGTSYLLPIHGIATPEALSRWKLALDRQAVNWDEIFDGFKVTAALAGSLFYKELVSKYPLAKVILTVRESNSWFESTNAMLSSAALAALKELPSWPVFAKALSAAYGDRFDDPESVIAAYERHNEEVQRSVPSHRLLVYMVSDGWAPLCGFLGIEKIPDTPFPRVAERQMWSGDLPQYRAHYAKVHTEVAARGQMKLDSQGNPTRRS